MATAKQRQETVRLLEKWRPMLFLGEWNFEVIFPDTDHDSAACEIHVDPVYLSAELRVYPCHFRAPNDVREHNIIHELCHVHTQAIWNVAGKLRDGVLVTEMEIRETVERLTQRISYIAARGKLPPRKREKAHGK